ncbi:sarcosine oxidase subunit gamma family protein [Mesorhizobium sp. DCY119]|uniref:sarcosine oxidase subunit gamma n=1 Tax=Mesorhizobium sp. DCY119 TaxID=2108445 RepID=UPI0014033120|nr:sarcosine oxidase subunit gamma family protein [Mesorhizobium sp. DCY119]
MLEALPPLRLNAPDSRSRDAAVTLSVFRNPLVGVMVARSAERQRLATAFREIVRAELPNGPKVTEGGFQVIGAGPDKWLIFSPEHHGSFDALSEAVGSSVLLLDQSSGWLAAQISGRMAPAVMRKGVQIDLHEKTFAQGDAALTILDQFWACIWVGPGPVSTFNCLVRRSFSAAFHVWFQEASAEFGSSASYV